MALITNTLDNGSNGQQTTLASLAASGSQPTYLIVNNASAPSGGSAMLYSNELAAKGVPMTVKVNGGITQNTYLRWDNGDTNGTRFVARRMLYLTANPGSTATILNMRGGSPVQFLGQLRVSTNIWLFPTPIPPDKKLQRSVNNRPYEGSFLVLGHMNKTVSKGYSSA